MENENTADKITIYLKKNLKKGYTQESLRQALLTQGYSRSEIDKAIKKMDQSLAKQAPILQKSSTSSQQVDINNIQVEPEEKKPFWKKWFS
jgi:uncharacterized protein Smg (DUF494 family)